MADRAGAPKRVISSGPLAVYATGFNAHLQGLGFLPFSAEHQLRLLAHLSRWMEERDLYPVLFGLIAATGVGLERHSGSGSTRPTSTRGS